MECRTIIFEISIFLVTLLGCSPHRAVFHPRATTSPESIRLDIKQLGTDSLELIFINSGTSDLYIFSYYFETRNYLNKYLLRYNQSQATLKLTFLPIVPYLGTEVTDRLILIDEYLFEAFQSKWTFVTVPASGERRILMNKDSLCMLQTSAEEILLDFDVSQTRKKNLEYIKQVDGQKTKPIEFEFAVYENIDILTKVGSNYRTPESYLTQADSYKVVRVETKLCSN